MDNWTYTADLTPVLGNGTDTADQILLLFHGLDTIANIVCPCLLSNSVDYMFCVSDSSWPARGLGQQPVSSICFGRFVSQLGIGRKLNGRIRIRLLLWPQR